MKKLFFLLVFLAILFTSTNTHAQAYKSAVGLRLGSPVSLSYKTHLNESNAIELMAGGRWYNGYSWFNVGAAYQIHKPLELDGIEGLQYYFGAGASAYFWSFDEVLLGSSETTFGVQGFLGAQYTFKDTPVSITVDWVPTIFINGFLSGFGGAYGGVGVRYVLKE